MMFPVISLFVITVLTSFELTGGVTFDGNIPKWANERHVTFLPPYTPIANKSADYIGKLKTSNISCSMHNDILIWDFINSDDLRKQ